MLMKTLKANKFILNNSLRILICMIFFALNLKRVNSSLFIIKLILFNYHEYEEDSLITKGENYAI